MADFNIRTPKGFVQQEKAKQKNFDDLTGRIFGKLTVIAYAGNDARGHTCWTCRCECGSEIITLRATLLRARTKSCGCFTPNRTHGLKGLPEYNAWHGMLQRCHGPRSRAYADYGGRGITICERWRESAANFVADMGTRPSPQHSLDRINVNGNYEPGNCRWATKKEQSRNTRRNIVVEFQGVTACLSEHCERLGVTPQMVNHRIRRGWSIERALSTPVRGRK